MHFYLYFAALHLLLLFHPSRPCSSLYLTYSACEGTVSNTYVPLCWQSRNSWARLHCIHLFRWFIHNLSRDHSLRIDHRSDEEVYSTVKSLLSASRQQEQLTWYTRIPMNPVKKYKTTLKAKFLWMAVPLIYPSTKVFSDVTHEWSGQLDD
jgi:hypothetical protein